MKSQKQSYVIIFIGALLLYLISTGASYALFTYFGPQRASVTLDEAADVDEEGFEVDESLPKTETCPLNGKLYTKPERTIWEKRRPMGVMVENSVDARPQSGLSKADIVYEAVAEGGITRFMGVFYCGVSENTSIAPVRSARTYFLDWISEYSENPLYVHVGGANCSADHTGQCTSDPRTQSLEQIEQYGWGGSSGNDLNQFRLSFPTCYRNPDRLGRPVATEHQMVCETTKLYDVAKEDGWIYTGQDGEAWDADFVSWQFADEADSQNRGSVDTIDLYFWEGYNNFDVTWEYDSEQNVYKRITGGKPHMDLETDTQITAKNIIVQLTPEEGPVDEHVHLLYETIGNGDALIFNNGDVIEGTWRKRSRTDRTRYYDANGREVSLVPGEIWIEIVPAGNSVTY